MLQNQQVYWKQPGGVIWKEVYQNNVPPSITQYASSSSEHVLFEQIGGYRGKVQKPKIDHPWEYYYDRITASVVDTRNISGGYQRIWGPALGTTPHSVTFSPVLDYNKSYEKALEKLNSGWTDAKGENHDGVRGNLDVSIDLAEAHKTRQMLKVSDRVVDYTRTFFKRKFGVARAMSNAWLEYTYGVKPLLSTLFGAADESLRTVINRLQRYQARGTVYVTPNVAIPWWYGTDYLEQKDMRNLKVKLSTTLGVQIYTDQWDPARWSTLNPIGIAWELTPYSFVFDWFLNVGGYLRNMETYLQYANKFKAGYRSDLAVFSGDINYRYLYVNYPTGTQFKTGKFEGIRFKRTILSAYPAPYLPQFQVDLGSSRLLSAAALLGQFLGRR
jgi:hypothetical protein